MTFSQRLTATQQKTNSLLCVGLDTDPAKVPEQFRKRPHGLLEFNKRIIDATVDIVSAYKLNFAFYEAFGRTGWKTLERTLAFIPSPIITIADAKRGDIGNTSEQYAKAILDDLGYDAITVAPYMGRDSVQPFFDHTDKGVFLLALTSNSGANDFQYKKVGKRRLFEEVVTVAQQWTKSDNLAFVVGATKSKDMTAVRKCAPHAHFLVPGVGAQGGSVEEVVKFGCRPDGTGVLINASRSIIYASAQKDFAAAARSEAMKLNNEINFFRNRFHSPR